MEQSTRFRMEDIPFDKLEKAGIHRDFVTRMESHELKDFLNGFRSDKLYTVSAKINNEEYRIPAKIRLQQNENGAVDVKCTPFSGCLCPMNLWATSLPNRKKRPC
jgi:hypothetical protein